MKEYQQPKRRYESEVCSNKFFYLNSGATVAAQSQQKRDGEKRGTHWTGKERGGGGCFGRPRSVGAALVDAMFIC